ncbi:hypothetical protein TIFTF001_034289 [Ficus carica]|uniref:Uncharacterized protein n=1 Tax=Ficus carica TaxID=3494 RepID=A0AA88E070_FICCA|nr:hypothetical protein TIFTF001_034289 [Ficus carica]
MFTDEKLKSFEGLKSGTDYIEVICGCTSKKFGDSVGKLRIFTTGQFLITCNLRLTPADFEKHTLQGGQRKWKNNIWVMVDKVKTELLKTGLLKYYKHSSNLQNEAYKNRRKWNFHRDEYLSCSKCQKERRFRLRTKEECRIFHDALAKKEWKCSDRPYDKITCKVDEERDCRKCCRGCPRLAKCKGCTSCVCFGCVLCRYLDCNCRACVDYMQNAAP